MEEGASSKVVHSYMFFPSFYVQPDPNNIMIIRGENNLTKLLDVELESPDHCSKGKSPPDDQCGRLCVRRCLVGCKINTLIFQYLFDISNFPLSDSAIARVRRSLERAEAVMTAPTLALEKLETRAPQGVRL